MDISVKKPPFASYSYDTASLDIAVALLPIIFWATLIFSWRALLLVLVGIVSCVLLDSLVSLILYKRFSTDLLSSAVTGTLVSLSVSVDAPVWTLLCGSVAAILAGKYSLCFLSKKASVVAPATLGMLVASLAAREVEPFTELFRSGDVPNDKIIDIFIGNIYGALGKVSVLLVLAAAIYLILRRTISIRVFLSALTVFAALSIAIYPEWTTYTDNLIYQMLGGGFLFSLVFGACDRNGTPITSVGKIIYGAAFALIAFFLRCYTNVSQPELLGAVAANVLSPVLDTIFKGQPFGGKRKI